MEKESGAVRTLRGVTNCPNIPATRALWVRTLQLWERQQENRQARLSFGPQINLPSYLPGDHIAFPLEKQRPQTSEGGSLSAAVSLVNSLQHFGGSGQLSLQGGSRELGQPTGLPPPWAVLAPARVWEPLCEGAAGTNRPVLKVQG